MSQSNYVVDNLISAKSIAARIEHLAKEIELAVSYTHLTLPTNREV